LESVPASAFARAAASFTSTSASTNSGYWEIGTPEIGKFSIALAVWTP
jgi:hypothetical protein